MSSSQPSNVPPVNYGVLLYPGFQALDTFGPLDFLNTVSLSYPINLHIIAATLDPVSTRPPPETIKDYSMGAISKFSQSIVPTHTIANPPTELDVLLVPGGFGSHEELVDEIQFIKDVYPKLKYLISVCTGATLLARAGVLDGRRATTNKEAWAWATSTGPNVNWAPVARWVVDGNVWTSSGVAAGMDATLAFIGHVYGLEVAEKYANELEYDWHRDAAWDPFAAVHRVPGARVK